MDHPPHPADGTVDDEAGAVARILASGARANGDDAALLRIPGGSACVSTDTTIAGVHAPAGTHPHALGRRAAARALSDMAAMAARPAAVLCAVVTPGGGWNAAVAAANGVRERARETGCELVGGDMSAAAAADQPLTVVVTALGTRAGAGGRFVSRSGMGAGDVLLVTGAVGASGAALRTGATLLPEPPDRVEAALALAPFLTALIDLSDGLASDARHLARSSECGAQIDLDLLPLAPGAHDALRAACDGDDYELLAAIPPERVEAARAALGTACPGLPLTAIGTASSAADGVEFRRRGRPAELAGGFTHR